MFHVITCSYIGTGYHMKHIKLRVLSNNLWSSCFDIATYNYMDCPKQMFILRAHAKILIQETRN